MKPRPNVLMIGGDLSSNGGIASVIKSYYSAHQIGGYKYDLHLLKTNYYKDKGLFFEVLIFLRSFFKAIYISVFKEIGIFHIHSSAKTSFYRKSFFILLGKIMQKKIILHLHSSDFYNFFLADRVVVNFILPMCDCAVVLCTDWENRLTDKFPKSRIVKIENPHEFLTRNAPYIERFNKKFTVLFVGFFIESKGIRDLIKLALEIKMRGRNDIVIQLAGKGDLEGHIRNEIESKKLNDVIDLVGWISGAEKIAMYSNADVFILPSYKEGMPISILEAMAYGLPIISTNIAGIPDIVENGKNGFLYNPGDVTGYLLGIEELISRKDLRERIYYENISRVKSNTKESIYSQVDNLYLKLMPPGQVDGN